VTVETHHGDVAGVVDAHGHGDDVPAAGVAPFGLTVGRVQHPFVTGVLIVVEDVFDVGFAIH